MSRDDYEAIKGIINHIIGDTQQGHVLLKAIKGYFSQKESVRVVRYERTIKAPNFTPNNNIINKIDKEANEAMEKYTKKLAKENEKFRNKYGKAKTCSVNS